jgi:ubiquinone/menaquinone biosynthesis C-methylase UbiE
MRVAKNSGDLRYRRRCIDKLGYPFSGAERLLDVGCGDGGVAALLRERVREVVAVDVEPSSEWRDEDGLRFDVADGERLPFGDAEFDLVHSKDALHHMESPERALQEYRRVLKPGGAALIVEANRYNPTLFVQMTLLRRHQHFTRARFRDLVQAAFPEVRFGSFEAHYLPGAHRVLSLQERAEESLQRLKSYERFRSYNFAVAHR